MEARLTAGLEVTALLRRAEALGGFGVVLHKGDDTRGTLLIAVLERGRHVTFLERTLGPGGQYRWGTAGSDSSDSQKSAIFIARRRSADPDQWVIELDIPAAERLIAEITSEG